jgi:putative membrane protein
MIDSTNIVDLFTRWDIPWAVTTTLALTALVYTRGWLLIRRTRPSQFPFWRLATFLCGIVALFVAVASPLDTFSESLLFMHWGSHAARSAPIRNSPIASPALCFALH